MTTKSIYEFLDYKAYLGHVELLRRPIERGFRSKLADGIGTQSSFISNVLNGEAHFSSEQILRIGKHLSLNAEENKYLYLLLQYARAGTPDLRTFVRAQIDALLEEVLDIQKRVGDSRSLSDSDQSTYYSSWHYTAIHLATTLPHLKTPDALAGALGLPKDVVRTALIFLLQTGILKETKNNQLEPGSVLIHLNRSSPNIRQHHTNWRVAAIRSLADEDQRDLHYSTISTLSKTDADRLRAEIVQLIERYVETVKPSKEEEMRAFTIDFFQLAR